MRFVICISDEEYSKIIKECGAKSHADVKNFLKQKYEISRDFSIWIYDNDNYEFMAINEEGGEK